MKNIFLVSLTLAFLTLTTGCGNSTEPVAEKQHKPHVWTSQTDALQEAKDTAEDISAAIELREKQSRPTN